MFLLTLPVSLPLAFLFGLYLFFTARGRAKNSNESDSKEPDPEAVKESGNKENKKPEPKPAEKHDDGHGKHGKKNTIIGLVLFIIVVVLIIGAIDMYIGGPIVKSFWHTSRTGPCCLVLHETPLAAVPAAPPQQSAGVANAEWRKAIAKARYHKMAPVTDDWSTLDWISIPENGFTLDLTPGPKSGQVEVQCAYSVEKPDQALDPGIGCKQGARWFRFRAGPATAEKADVSDGFNASQTVLVRHPVDVHWNFSDSLAS